MNHNFSVFCDINFLFQKSYQISSLPLALCWCPHTRCSRSLGVWGTYHSGPRQWHMLGRAGCVHQAALGPLAWCIDGGTRTLTPQATPSLHLHSCSIPTCINEMSVYHIQ